MAVEAQRGALGMSRDEFAAKAGVDRKTVYNLEKDGKWPIARTRARIEAALGWAPGEMERIASAGEEPPPLSPDILRAFERRYPDPELRRKAIEALEAVERGEAWAPSPGRQPGPGRRAG